MQITDFERVATVTLPFARCPKCNFKYLVERHGSAPRREWDCRKCGRGWIQVADDVTTVEMAHCDIEACDQHG